MDWFRWHHGSVTDQKFQLVAKKSGASVAEVIGVWATLLEAASMADERGVHGVLDFESLDCSLGLSDGMAQQIYNLMADRALVDPQTHGIKAWSRRQPLRERDDLTATDRKRTQRERDHANHQNVTPNTASKNHVTPCHTKKSLEEIRGEEIREEGEKTHTAEFGESNDQLPTPPPPPGVSSSPGAVCKAIKSVGINAVNPAHPEFLALLAQGVTQESFVESAKLAHAKHKGFAYLLGVVKGQLQDAKTSAEGEGCRPIPRNTAQPSPESFKQRDDRIARQRWEEQTGREHPDNAKERTISATVIDITPHPLELVHDASR